MFSLANDPCTLSQIYAEVSEHSEGKRGVIRLGQEKGRQEGGDQVRTREGKARGV